EGADVGVLDDTALADDERAAEDRILNGGARADDDLPLRAGRPVQVPAQKPLRARKDHPVRLQHVFELPGILPPSRNDVAVDVLAVVDQPLDRVRDLELVSERRLDPVDRLEDVRVEHVDADERQVRLRLLRLLGEPLHAGSLELGDAELLGIGHVREQDLAVRPVALELANERRDPVQDQVVPQVHDEGIVPHEIARDFDRVGQAERRFLADVGGLDPQGRSVPQRPADLGLGVADDNAHVGDARVADRLDPVEENRLVAHGDELLRPGVGDGTEPGPLAAAQNERLHPDFLPAAEPFSRSRANARPRSSTSLMRDASRAPATACSGFPPPFPSTIDTASLAQSGAGRTPLRPEPTEATTESLPSIDAARSPPPCGSFWRIRSPASRSSSTPCAPTSATTIGGSPD